MAKFEKAVLSSYNCGILCSGIRENFSASCRDWINKPQARLGFKIEHFVKLTIENFEFEFAKLDEGLLLHDKV